MTELTTKQAINAAVTALRAFADRCPQKAIDHTFRCSWAGCPEVDDKGRYDKTDGSCSPGRECECWRQYLYQEAHK